MGGEGKEISFYDKLIIVFTRSISFKPFDKQVLWQIQMVNVCLSAAFIRVICEGGICENVIMRHVVI